MKITIEVSSQSELEKLFVFFQTIKLDSLRVISDTLAPKSKKSNKKVIKITKGDKSLDPSELFGMWADNPQTLESIRQQAWERAEI